MDQRDNKSGEAPDNAGRTFVRPPGLLDYQIALYHRGLQTETFAGIELADDQTAIKFAGQVIRDLMKADGKKYPTHTLQLSCDRRVVQTIPFAHPEFLFPK